MTPMSCSAVLWEFDTLAAGNYCILAQAPTRKVVLLGGPTDTTPIREVDRKR